MSNRLDTRLNNNGHVIEQISAYLDGALDDVASDKVDAHLTGCAECRAEYTEVRVTRQLLRNTVTVPPPRAFTLTEDMIGRKRWSWGRLLVPRNVPRLLSGSAAVFALVAILFVMDLSNLGTRQHTVFSARAPVLKQAVPADQGRAYDIIAPTPGGSAYDTIAPTPGGSDDSQASGSVAEGTANLQLPAVPMSTSMAANSAGVQATTTAGASSGLSLTATEVVPQVTTGAGSDKLQSQSPPDNATPQIMDAFTSPTAAGYLDAPETRGSVPDGGRILLFSVEGLLVALGAVLALGAVFAARR